MTWEVFAELAVDERRGRHPQESMLQGVATELNEVLRAKHRGQVQYEHGRLKIMLRMGDEYLDEGAVHKSALDLLERTLENLGLWESQFRWAQVDVLHNQD